MALDLSIHDLPTIRNGSQTPAARLPAVATPTVALDTPSAGIAGPCLVRMMAGEDARFDIRADADDLDAAGGILIKAGVDYFWELPPGVWFIEATAA